MQTRKASIKETGEELSQADWERFDAAVAATESERGTAGRRTVEPAERDGVPAGSGETGAPGRSAPDADREEPAPVRP